MAKKAQSPREYINSLKFEHLPSKSKEIIKNELLSDDDLDLISMEDDEMKEFVKVIEKHYPEAVGLKKKAKPSTGDEKLQKVEGAIAGLNLLLSRLKDEEKKGKVQGAISGLTLLKDRLKKTIADKKEADRKPLTLADIPPLVKEFMPEFEQQALVGSMDHHEILEKLEERIKNMPKSYETDGQGKDAIAYLHYFSSNDSHWFITEKDAGGEIEEGVWDDTQRQAFGFVILGGDWAFAEMGYINIEELKKTGKVELDLFWTPKSIKEIIDEHTKKVTAPPKITESGQAEPKYQIGDIVSAVTPNQNYDNIEITESPIWMDEEWYYDLGGVEDIAESQIISKLRDGGYLAVDRYSINDPHEGGDNIIMTFTDDSGTQHTLQTDVNPQYNEYTLILDGKEGDWLSDILKESDDSSVNAMKQFFRYMRDNYPEVDQALPFACGGAVHERKQLGGLIALGLAGAVGYYVGKTKGMEKGIKYSVKKMADGGEAGYGEIGGFGGSGVIEVKPKHAHRDEVQELLDYLEVGGYPYWRTESVEQRSNNELPYIQIAVDHKSPQVLEELHLYLQDEHWDWSNIYEKGGQAYAGGGEIKVGDRVNLKEIRLPNGDIQFERVEDGEVYFIKDGIYGIKNPKTMRTHQVRLDQIEGYSDGGEISIGDEVKFQVPYFEGKFNYTGTVLDVSGKIARVSYYEPNTDKTNITEIEVSRLTKSSNTYSDGGVAESYGISITEGEYDEQPIMIWEMTEAKGKKFGDWESAMRWLVDEWKADEDLYEYFRGELGTSDNLIIGDQEFVGIDVQDHMTLTDEDFYGDGGEITSIDWKNFSLAELQSALPSDVMVRWLMVGTSKQSANQPYYSPSDKEFRKLEDHKFTISDYGYAEVAKGSENIYLDFWIYDLEDDKTYEISLYSKADHEGLKMIAENFIKKMRDGGEVQYTEDEHEEYMNEVGEMYDYEDNRWIIGGDHRYDETGGKYGVALRKYDPISWNISYREEMADHFAKGDEIEINQDGSNIPEELKSIFDNELDLDRVGDYSHMEEVRMKANEIGYDFDYDLSGTPTTFQKLEDGGETNPYRHTYMLLSRLKMDNEYYLGHGGRHEKHLWAGDVDSQIAKMKELWNSLPEDGKPEWLSMEEIEEYEQKMKDPSTYAKGGEVPYGIKIMGKNPHKIAGEMKHLNARVQDDYLVFPTFDSASEAVSWLNENNIGYGDISKMRYYKDGGEISIGDEVKFQVPYFEGKFNYTGTVLDVSGKIARVSYYEPNTDKTNITEIEVSRLTKSSNTYSDGGVAESYGISITEGEYDEQPIMIWEMTEAKGKKFGDWESAMRWLVDEWKADEDLYEYFRGELGTSDNLIIGDQEFVGIDVQDHMTLTDEDFYGDGGEITSIDWKNFSLAELQSALPSDVMVRWLMVGTSKQSANQPYYSPSDKEFRKLEDHKFTISDYGYAEVAKGSENIYLDFWIYDLEDDKTYEISLYSKADHEGLKMIAENFIKKMRDGGEVQYTEDEHEEYMNEVGEMYDYEDNRWIIGGDHRYDETGGKYGVALRKYDPISWNISYREEMADHFAKGDEIEINQDGSNIPEELKSIFDNELDLDRVGDYSHMEEVRMKANEIGYDFDYDLSGTPTTFQKLEDGGETNPYRHTYMLLSRLKMDNEYYLGHGGRHEKHLWAGDVDSQIAKMKELWNSLPEDGKPEWLSMEEIEEYEQKMKDPSTYAKGGEVPYGIKIMGKNPHKIAGEMKHLNARVQDDYLVFPTFDSASEAVSWLNENNIGYGDISKMRYYKDGGEAGYGEIGGFGGSGVIEVKPKHAHRDEVQELLDYLEVGGYPYWRTESVEQRSNNELPYIQIAVDHKSPQVLEELHLYLQDEHWDWSNIYEKGGQAYAGGGEIKVGDRVNLKEIRLPNGDIQFERVEDGEVYFIKDGIYGIKNPKTMRTHQVRLDQIEGYSDGGEISIGDEVKFQVPYFEGKFNYTGTVLDVSGKIARVSYYEPNTDKTNITEIEVSRLTKSSNTYSDGGVAESYGISITEGEYDEQPIMIWEMTEAKGKKFGDWESAMRWLVDEWKADEDLYEYFRGELGTSDNLIIGDQEFVGIDVQDHMTLTDEDFYGDGGEITSIDWKNFSLAELQSALPSDVMVRWLMVGTSKQSANQPYYSPSDKEFRKLEDHKFTISDYGYAEVAKGSENIYLDFWIYDLEDDKTYEISLYSKADHEGLKMIAENFIKKMRDGGEVQYTEDEHEEYMNEVGEMYDYEDNRWIIGGDHRYDETGGKYGVALRKYDPISWNISYREEMADHFAKGDEIEINQDGSNIPEELKSIFDNELDLDRVGDYSHMEEVRMKANEIGYDFDYDLSGTPTTFQKLEDGGETNPYRHTYMLLSRLKMDNEYYLGHGGRHEKHLWAGDVDSQIAKMKELWNSLPEDGKPEWLSMEEIEEYEQKMKDPSTYAKGGEVPYGIKIMGKNPHKIAGEMKHLNARVQDDYLVFPTFDSASEAVSWLNENNIGYGDISKMRYYKDGGETWVQDAVQQMKEKGTVGSFSKKAKNRNMSTVEFAKKVLANPDRHQARTIKQAQFMKNMNPALFK